MLGYFKRRRRGHLRARPFPASWRRVLHRNLTPFDYFDEADRRELEGHIQVLLGEKHFEGCGGLQLTDEIRVTIAGWASLLLLHRPTDYFPDLTSILVYPTTYVADVVEYGSDGVVSEFAEDRSGESWHHGALILAWEDVLAGSEAADGFNVVLHEFAHQLDLENGAMDGAPKLEPQRYKRWGEVMERSFSELDRRVESRERSVIDEYGASDPIEFFAVATESFFELPASLREHYPDLYEELRAYYRQDPASWGVPVRARRRVRRRRAR